jgi:hypothetical protein
MMGRRYIFMKKSPVIIAAALLGLLIVLLVLFYLSPFSETTPSRVYENPEVGAGHTFPIQPVYGNPISGKDATVGFPFRMIDNVETEFCLNNTKKIEELCGTTPNQVLLLDVGPGLFHCTYITLDTSGGVQNFVDIEKTSGDVSGTGVATVSGMSWKSNLTNFSFKDTCTSSALASISSQ